MSYLSISVPVTDASLTQSGPVHENTSVRFICTSYFSLPAAQIHWFRSYSISTVEMTDNADVDITRETDRGEYNLIQVTDTLTYRVYRSVNGWSIFCSATGWQSNVTSNKIELSVKCKYFWGILKVIIC